MTGVTRHDILNLGAGVQSTALYLMFLRGQITPQIECAIFADTQDEPGAEQRRLGMPDPEGSVYAHLDWLMSLNGPPILVRTIGQLSADLMRGENSTKQRFASIPVFTQSPTASTGQARRQCSAEYKINVINQAIRREICGAERGRSIGREHEVIQYIGISADEASRAVRVMRNAVPVSARARAARWNYQDLLAFFASRNWRFCFPLVDHGVSRADCVKYLSGIVPHVTPRSACTFCPYHDDAEWNRLKQDDPIGFGRAVDVDAALRQPGVIVNRNMDQPMYLHRSCVPLDQVVFRQQARPDPTAQFQLFRSKFADECLGVCGV